MTRKPHSSSTRTGPQAPVEMPGQGQAAHEGGVTEGVMELEKPKGLMTGETQERIRSIKPPEGEELDLSPENWTRTPRFPAAKKFEKYAKIADEIDADVKECEQRIAELEGELGAEYEMLKRFASLKAALLGESPVAEKPEKAPRAPRQPREASGATGRTNNPRGQAFEEIRGIIEAAGPKTGLTRKQIMEKLNAASSTPLYSRYANALAAAEKKGHVVKHSSGAFTLAND